MATFLLAVMLAPANGKVTASKSRTERCSNSALKEMLTSTHPATARLDQMLVCLGKSADRLLAAQAAYEIALSFAAANGVTGLLTSAQQQSGRANPQSI